MNSIWCIAHKEFSDGLRNRWLVSITLLFAALAIGIAWLGAAASGQVGFTSISATVASLTSLATFLIPLIALLLAYDAIVGEDEGGTLLLLLTYPLNPKQVLLGKFIGHGVILALATLIGFGSAALVIGIFAQNISLTTLTWAFIRFMLSSTLLGWVFLAIAYVLSCKVNEKSHAAGLALGVWFLFVLVFDLLLLALLVVSKGHFSADVFPWLLLLNPTDIYRLINLANFNDKGADLGVISLGSELPFSPWILAVILLLWVVGTLWLAYYFFRRRIV